MKRALVLSGGGSNGAWQYGAFRYLQEQVLPKGEHFDVVAGISVGSLNGSMISMHKYDELHSIWHNIQPSQITEGKMKGFRIAWRALRGKRGVMSNAPLRKMLSEHLNYRDLKSKFFYGVCNLKTGEYIPLANPQTNEEFVEGVLASATIPVVWSPIGDWVDGGLRNISPLGDVINEQPDEVFIINCNSIFMKEDNPKNILQIAGRSLEIALNEIFASDLREFLRINHLAKHYDIPYKHYKVTIITPNAPLGDALDFSNAKAQRLQMEGYDAAREVIERKNAEESKNKESTKSKS